MFLTIQFNSTGHGVKAYRLFQSIYPSYDGIPAIYYFNKSVILFTRVLTDLQTDMVSASDNSSSLSSIFEISFSAPKRVGLQVLGEGPSLDPLSLLMD